MTDEKIIGYDEIAEMDAATIELLLQQESKDSSFHANIWHDGKELTNLFWPNRVNNP